MGFARVLALPWDVRVYRVEGLANRRLSVNSAGAVMVSGTGMLFLNFGQSERARAFWIRRVTQGFDAVAIRSVKIRRLDLWRIRHRAVPERLARMYPHRPLIVDRTWRDQYGLPQTAWESLFQGTVRRAGRAWDEP
jgi:hypothetical protein